MIVVHAGNRVDEPGRTPPRFPADHSGRVRDRFDALLDLGVEAAVTAAAAGADLLFVEGPVHVVPPFAADRYRNESVADRGERWVRSYDRMLEAVSRGGVGSLLVLDVDPDDAGFRAANGKLIERACSLFPGRVLAVAVRPRHRHGQHSVTDDFVERAEATGLFVLEIDPLTC
jgi:hypothetical protein